MLQNINEHICVSRHSANNHERWICYEPYDASSNNKRQTWKRLTGLLSTSEMQCYLDRSHSSDVSKRFTSLSA